ncbi:MAG TPA: SIS domain-containing protein [Xanthobacteraceae bacterium]
MSKPDFRVDNREVRRYFTALSGYLVDAAVTSSSGQTLDMAEAVNQVMAQARRAHAAGNKLIFVGNGGSAGISSHMATDYSKNGDVRAMALNDVSMVTCLGNDLGYDRIFAKQIELYARPDDLLIAISSSGRSANILNAVKAARAAECAVVTFSGFTPDNPLRRLGDLNFYINSDRYGFVEIGHLTICHAILDFICGLRVPEGMMPTGATAA